MKTINENETFRKRSPEWNCLSRVRVDANLFLKTEKKSYVFKRIRIRVDRALGPVYMRVGDPW